MKIALKHGYERHFENARGEASKKPEGIDDNIRIVIADQVHIESRFASSGFVRQNG